MKNELCVLKNVSRGERVTVHICIFCSLKGIKWDGPPRPILYLFDEENKRGPLWYLKKKKLPKKKKKKKKIIDKIYIDILFVFRKFATELWPLIDVRICSLLNILRTI